MMTAIASVEFAGTGLSRDTRYSMLNGWGSQRVRELCDGFRETQRAIDMLGFTKSQKKDIFLVLSLIVHMGDIQFVQNDDYCKIDIDDQRT